MCSFAYDDNDAVKTFLEGTFHGNIHCCADFYVEYVRGLNPAPNKKASIKSNPGLT